MSENTKKLLILLTVIAMVFSMMPLSVSAQSITEETPSTSEEVLKPVTDSVPKAENEQPVTSGSATYDQVSLDYGTLDNAYDYIIQNDQAIITRCYLEDAVVKIPDTINGYPVVGIRGLGSSTQYIEDLTIPDSVTMLSENFLSDWYAVPLKKLTLGAGISSFNMNMLAFAYTTNLESIEVSPLNNTFESVDGVLYNEKVTTLIAYPPAKTDLHEMPNTVTEANILFDGWYTWMFSAIKVKYSNSLTNMKIVDNFLYSTDMTTLLKVDPSATGSYVMPDSVVNIEAYAFAGSKLTSVTISPNVTSLTYGSFANAINLEEITIPETLQSIDGGSFADCNSLNKVFITDLLAWCNIHFSENPLAYAGNLYLNGELVEDLVIPENSITEIGINTFYGGNFKSVTIPAQIKSIDSGAFGRCSQLEKVYITDLNAWASINFATESANPLYYAEGLYLNGEEVTDLSALTSANRIGSYAFYGTSFKSVTIPGSVTSIGDAAFADSFLKEVIFVEGNLQSIGYSAFKNSDLTSVTLPKSLKAVYGSAFADCKYLEEVIFDCESVTIGNYAFQDCALGDLDFADDNITDIGVYAFSYNTSNQIKLPSSVTELTYRAFAFNENLVSVTIPDSITEIYYSFDGDKILDHVLYTGTEEQWQAIDIEGEELSNATLHCNATGDEVTTSQNCTTITLHCSICNESKTIYKSYTEHVMDENGKCTICGHSGIWDYDVNADGTVTIFGYSGKANELIVPATIDGKTVTAITSTLFSYHSDLRSVVLPDSVTEIPANAFRNCIYLSSVTLGSKVTTIGEKAFMGCRWLRQIDLPDTVTSLGKYAFADTSIYEVKLPAGITEISDGLYRGCDLYEVTIPDTVTAIGYYAFESNYISTLAIPASVKTIAPGAFTYVYTAVFLGDQPSMDGAFSGCYGMNAYYPIGNPTWANIPDDYNNWKVCEKPEIYYQPQTVTVLDGESATIEVSASGVGLNYQWYCAAPGENKFQLVAEGQDWYEMVVTPENSGSRFYCIVTDLAGQVIRSETVYMKLHSDPVGIRISRLPYKLAYSIGELLGSFEVMLINADGTEEPIYDYMTEQHDPFTPGEQTVTVTYGDFSASFTITVNGDKECIGNYGNESMTIHVPTGSLPEGAYAVGNSANPYYTFDQFPDVLQNRQYAVYDIQLKNADAEVIQPTQPVDVHIPVPYQMEGRRCKVYYIDQNGVETDMNAVYSDGYMTFTTDHFSAYAIVEVEGVTVSGTVRGSNLLGTQIHLIRGNEILATATADSKGKYQLHYVLAGDYEIQVVRNGEEPKRANLTVAEDPVTIPDIQLAIPGDIDGNEVVNRDDVIKLLLHVTMPSRFPIDAEADFNGDGAVTRDDVIKLLLHVTMPGRFPL